MSAFAKLVSATRDPLDAQAVLEAMFSLQTATDKAERRRGLALHDDDLMDALDRAVFDARKALRAQLRLAGINPAVLAECGQ